jgi:tungstate transport system substrate-binding protein
MRVIVAVATMFIVACSTNVRHDILIATTTSVQNSGLMDYLRPAFREHSGLDLLVHSAGSGRALQQLESGEADLVISHAPLTEARLLAQHPDWWYRKFAYNRFVVVGPTDDPARIASAGNVVDAFQRIADAGARFVSRGDQSGTHEREETFWTLAGRRPIGDRLIVSGRGMAQALRHANEAAGYTLTDEPTFWQLRDQLQLVSLFAADARLQNTYALIAPSNNQQAAVFVQWLAPDEGMGRVGSFTIDGKRAYEPWPSDCPRARPADRPCHHGNSSTEGGRER